jgi:acetyltransferase-like isoleucine patch superfamily enzyme
VSRLKERLRWLPRDLGYFRGPRLASALRKRWVLLRHPHVDLQFGKNVYFGPGFSLHAPAGGTLHVGDHVQFRRGFRLELGAPTTRVTIGDGSIFTYDVIMQCTTSIDIGRRVMFGQATIVIDGNHRFRDLDTPMLDQGYDFTPLVIEDDATVTTKCTIIANLGRRCFIGANSVVTRDVPPYCVAAGVPARVLEYFGPPGQEPPGYNGKSGAGDGGTSSPAASQASR